MQSLERATILLRDASSLEGATAILCELGFTHPALPLDSIARNALGLSAAVRAAWISQGRDSLRGLAVDLGDCPESRDALTALASALARRSPHLLWLVVGFAAGRREIAIVCWTTMTSRPRIVSLQCNQDRLFQSDAETLCALSAATGDTDLTIHARWVDVLGRVAITRRFFHTLRSVVVELGDSLGSGVNRAERRELALLYISRLIFLSFLEAKGWLDSDFGFLGNGYLQCVSEGRGSYQRSILEPLFFGTLNTPLNARSARARTFGRIPFLNGGLFARSHLEKRRRSCVFADEAFGNAYGSLLSRYRFSAREDSAAWSEASIDPEILGKAFEALMASDERKTSGAFYTPQALVEEVVDKALHSVFPMIEERPRRAPAGDKQMLARLHNLKVLDPACGSGAFLVHVLERIAALRLECGEDDSIAVIRRRVLMSSIFGVDLNPMAVWLCELRLWLSIVIESPEDDPMRMVPLPNLDRHIRVGDSLAGGAFDNRVRFGAGRKLTSLRNRYMRASGPRKRTLARAMDREERDAAINVLRRERARLTACRKEMLTTIRGRDLFGERHHPDHDARARLANVRSHIREINRQETKLRDGAALPFSFAAHFSDVAATGGFDLVVGNPPWVRIHQIAEPSKERLRNEFEVYRNAAWEAGAAAAGAGRGFAAQVDMASLFVERSCGLLGPGATMALLLPSKLWHSLAGGGVRQLLLERTDLVSLDYFSESDSGFEAVVYPSLLVARKSEPTTMESPRSVRASVRLRDRVVKWRCAPRSLVLDETEGSPWILLPDRPREAFDRIRSAGIALAQIFGRPLLGVKTGCNEAFVVRVEGIDGDVASITSGGHTGQIERAVLRPLVRGETLAPWRIAGPREYVIWPHCDDNQPMRALPPLARRWLFSFRARLHGRSDLHGRLPWWALFRTESASAISPRVIWADVALAPRAVAVEAHDPIVALNSCYVAGCATMQDANALAALLNGPIAAAWLNTLAEPARGGYRRYLGWTMSLLPIPKDWIGAREQLARLGERASLGDVPTQDEMMDAALDAYGLETPDIEALLSWTAPCD